jgi:hypothetical protein
VLDELDRELERRGLRFARYADGCNVYVRSRRAGERVASTVAFSRVLADSHPVKNIPFGYQMGEQQIVLENKSYPPFLDGHVQLSRREGHVQQEGEASLLRGEKPVLP